LSAVLRLPHPLDGATACHQPTTPGADAPAFALQTATPPEGVCRVRSHLAPAGLLGPTPTLMNPFFFAYNQGASGLQASPYHARGNPLPGL